MWFEDAPDGDRHPDPGAGRRCTVALGAVTVVVTAASRRPPRRASATSPTRSASLALGALTPRVRARPMATGRLDRASWPTRIRRDGPVAVRRGRGRSRSTTRTHGFFAVGGGAGRAAGRLPHQPRGRAAVRRRRRPGARRAGGTSSVGPIPSPSSRPAAGPGTLARAVLAAAPGVRSARCATCSSSGPPALRDRQREHLAARRRRERSAFPPATPTTSTARAPSAGSVRVVVLAGRAADAPRSPASCSPTSCSTTSPFRLLERRRRRLARGAGRARPATSCRWSSSLVPADAADARAGRPAGARRRRRRASSRSSAAAADWLGRGPRPLVERGRVVVIDYGADHGRPGRPTARTEWLRTYRGHERGGAPARRPRHARTSPCEVAVDQLARVGRPASTESQADFLARPRHRRPGRRGPARSGPSGPTSATSRRIRARSRVGEAEALTDPAGLGAFRVLEWPVP